MLRLLLPLFFIASASAAAIGGKLPEMTPLPADATLEMKQREALWLLNDANRLLKVADALDGYVNYFQFFIKERFKNDAVGRKGQEESLTLLQKCTKEAKDLSETERGKGHALLMSIKALENPAPTPSP